MKGSPRVFASTGCIAGKQPILDRISRFQHAGIRRIELGAGLTVGDGDLDLLNKERGEFLVHNYFPPPQEPFVLNLASQDETVRRLSLDLATQAVRLCDRLGATFYSVHAGFITDPEGFADGTFAFPAPASDRERDTALATFVASIETILTATRHCRVKVLVENNVCYPHHAGKLLMQSPTEFQEFFEHLRSERVGILLDTGHLNVSATTLGFDRMTFPRLLGDRIWGIHLHDNDGSADQHLPTSGDSWIFGALNELDAVDSIVVEAKFDSVERLSDHVEWLESLTTETTA